MSTMADPIVPIPSFEELSPAFQARARRGRERLGVNVNSLHAFAHSEELGGATRDYFESVAKLTELPNDLRLLIRLAVATANQCRYCTAHQRHQLAGLGVSEEKMAAIWKPDTDELSPRERAAVALRRRSRSMPAVFQPMFMPTSSESSRRRSGSKWRSWRRRWGC